MESHRCGFVNLLQTDSAIPLSNKHEFSNSNINLSQPSKNNNFNKSNNSHNKNSNHNHHNPLIRQILFQKLNLHHHHLNQKRKNEKNRPDPPPPKKGSHGQKRKKKLADAWILTSQDPIEADSQTFSCFWEKVRVVFYVLTGSEKQNLGQISSKWHDIRLKCTEFGGIYNNLLNRQSNRLNNFDVFMTALDKF
uniref:Uncharacterized protein n=1 Tax=Lactuca sativa TaxID=4236 RepID=A0A9R1X1G4_LACSA|nr:hypothetical protein LSAT_V11C700361700 [Lactuca sativa]